MSTPVPAAQTATSSSFSREAFEAWLATRNEPEFVVARRRQAFELYQERLETPLDPEEYKRVDLRTFRKQPHQPRMRLIEADDPPGGATAASDLLDHVQPRVETELGAAAAAWLEGPEQPCLPQQLDVLVEQPAGSRRPGAAIREYGRQSGRAGNMLATGVGRNQAPGYCIVEHRTSRSRD